MDDQQRRQYCCFTCRVSTPVFPSALRLKELPVWRVEGTVRHAVNVQSKAACCKVRQRCLATQYWLRGGREVKMFVWRHRVLLIRTIILFREVVILTCATGMK